MKLYLLRHGEAESRAETDAQRQLTNKGRQEALDVAVQFTKKGLKIDRCFVSPYVRAIQTADSFLSRIPGGPMMEIQALLSPEIRAAEVIKFLETLPEENILLVTHNPLVSELNAVLLEGNIDHMEILGTCELSSLELEIVADAMATQVFFLSPNVPD